MESEQKRTKLSIIVYVLLTFALSSIFYVLVIRRTNAGQSLGFLILGLMWCPGISGLATRLIFQGNLRGHGFLWGKTKYQFASYWIPLAYASAVYLPIWFAGYAHLSGRLIPRLVPLFGDAHQQSAVVLLNFLYLATIGVAGSCISALGEELGWRGFLVPQLAKIVPFHRVALISGIIWALWHYPVILFGDYHGAGPVWYSIACFTVMVVSMSFLFAWMRLRSGSVWTGMLLHASHNLFIQAFFDPQTRHARLSDLWTTEFGAGLAIVSIVVALIVANKSSELPPPEASTAGAA
jgi:membrane protease YdiL (CAAX protease family)